MRIRSSACYLIALLPGIVALAAADTTLRATAGGLEAATSAPANAVPAANSATPAASREKCLARCASDSGLCNSEVRRGRQECSKKAANNGNNPMTGRPDDAYCGYFNANHCGDYGGRGSKHASCGQRFARRYAECVTWMRGNISAQRFDCFKAETKAQGLCRAELKDCQAECE